MAKQPQARACSSPWCWSNVLDMSYTEGQWTGLSSLILPCSSNMKRAASLNYLNQPSAAPLQVSKELQKAAPGQQEGERVTYEEVGLGDGSPLGAQLMGWYWRCWA